MPYIAQKDKIRLKTGGRPAKAGELNYELTQVCVQYLLDRGLSYAAINDVIGALEGVKLELYRRIAMPYEEKKRAENGDVYGALPQVLKGELCPHGDGWDDCPVCRH